ncbi:MAG TPA: GIY-YIG nuclease family protein [Candidatus Paceibacterota bacterium]|jgi:putative endonuclease|nr:GIY-YIG nuclease family protein [Candidatus Paceibacterota bacterium]
MFYVYILKSLKDNDLYIGRTNNIDRRIKEHNNGKVSSTKSRRPFVFLKIIEVESEKESVEMEKEYKKGFRREQIKREFKI